MKTQYCTVMDEDRVRIVTLNRPEVLNALHADANDELAAVWDEFAERDDLWVGIVTGAGGRAFSAGNDLKVQAAGKRRPNGPRGFAGITHRFDLFKPMIAAVNGDYVMSGWPVRFGGEPPAVGPAPLLGQHSADVLEDWLKMDKDAIGGLKAEKVIAG